MDRRGEIRLCCVGDHGRVVLPALDDYRVGPTGLRGLRLIHTHLKGEGLTEDDLTDLALLRLDLVAAVTVEADGSPGVVHGAHLVPENPQGRQWAFLRPARPGELDLDFLAFIRALEDDLSRQQRTREVDARERAFLIRVETAPGADPEGSLAELAELARSAGVRVFDRTVQYRDALDPRYVMGRGRLSDVVIRALQMGANLLIFDHELTPAQVRSIGEFTQLKVIDRTQLILDIFAQRAHSREGKIQVELAQLRYLLPRLTGKGTALSRLAGGIGARGPGETKLEIDRRRIRDRIHLLEKALRDIEKARGQRRRRRERTGLPIVSIVGYTNAGKSTLLNSLTRSSVLAEDRLFATLDPKSSRLRFPRDTEALVTDTVGFIRDLPQELFAAFRATLDELRDAHLLLHVVDIANPSFADQIAAVERIIAHLDLADKPLVRVFNKMDRFPDRDLLGDLCRRYDAVAVSALDQGTLMPLLERLEPVVRDLGRQSRAGETP